MSTTVEAGLPTRAHIQRPWAALLLALIVLAASISCYRALTMRPVFWDLLVKDFEMELPLITHVAMSPWFALTFPALALLAVCLELFRSRWATFVNTVILMAIYLLWEFFREAMFLPFLHLLKRLGE